MPQISRILFPVDFSDASLGAARYVELFAGIFQSEVMLLHAVTMGEHALAEELLPQRKVQLDAFMADEFRYFTTHRLCTVGDPMALLTDVSASWKPDLIMLPTHGLGFFRRHLLGSVTAKVLHDLGCPVWTSVHGEVVEPLENIHCRRIIAAVDLTGRSAEVLRWTTWLARECDATVTLVHALPGFDASGQVWPVAEEYQRSLREKAGAEICRLQRQVGVTGPVEIRPGTPAAAVTAAVNETGADLVVIGRHSSDGIAGALLQNAFAILGTSPCPVISV